MRQAERQLNRLFRVCSCDGDVTDGRGVAPRRRGVRPLPDGAGVPDTSHQRVPTENSIVTVLPPPLRIRRRPRAGTPEEEAPFGFDGIFGVGAPEIAVTLTMGYLIPDRPTCTNS